MSTITFKSSNSNCVAKFISFWKNRLLATNKEIRAFEMSNSKGIHSITLYY